MKKLNLHFKIVILISAFLISSKNIYSQNDSKINFTDKNKSAPIAIDNNNNNPISTGFDYFSDDFTAPNDTAALKARGYLVYRNGTFTGSTPPNFWRTGIAGAFPPFNGADTDYVASGFPTAGDLGDIDNWLVLPDLDVVALDSISFYSRAGSQVYPDSIRVMFNHLGGTLPNSPGWIELGRFKVNVGAWELRSFAIPTTAAFARLAIRYSVVDGGAFGANSFYIGIDALRVQGQGVQPVELSSFVSVISNNNVTLNWTTATETNNSGFEVERRDARGETQDVWNKIGFVEGNGTSTTSQNYSYNDKGLNSGKYNYRLKQIDFNGNFEYFNLSNDVIVGIPGKFELSQNYPNPFNPNTVISYQLAVNSIASLKIYDVLGNEVATLVNEKQDAGYYAINFEGSKLSSGVYFYKLAVDGNIIDTKRMMLLK